MIHLWGSSTRLYEVTRDPEGLLSTLPAIATALLGVFTGEWLRSKRTPQRKALGMLVFGVIGLILGETWGIWFPINKKLWTSSYVLFTAGFALICLALCYWATDIKRWRGAWTRPFLIFGRNAITAYVIADLFAVLLYAFNARVNGRMMDGQQLIFQRFFASPGKPELLLAPVFPGIRAVVSATHLAHGSQEDIPENLNRMSYRVVRLSIHPCRIKTAAIRSTAFARFSIDSSVSRSRRFASADVSRSSHKCTGSRNRFRSSSANTCIFSDCVPSAPLMRKGSPTTISRTA